MVIEAEPKAKGITISEVKDVLIGEGFDPETLDNRIILETRQNIGTQPTDVDSAIGLLWQASLIDPKLKESFQRRGIKRSVVDIRNKFFGKMEIDSGNANLVRNEEEKKLDEEAKQRWEKAMEENRLAMDAINSRQK